MSPTSEESTAPGTAVQKCGNCCFVRKTNPSGVVGEAALMCHWNPPQVVMQRDGRSVLAVFPPVLDGEWCAQWGHLVNAPRLPMPG